MINKFAGINKGYSMRLLFVLFSVLLLNACVAPDEAMSRNDDLLIDARIVGSAEVPDPVLERVQELEKQGMVRDVVIFESFPVQIRLKATQAVVDDLNKIPRVKGAIY